MKKIILLLLIAYSTSSIAQTKLASFFGDNMVLQQEDTVSIWGYDTPETDITVSAGWGQKVSTKADENGKWRVKLPTPKADKKPYTLSISGSKKIVFNNVLLGEVWFCSGQSNMEMPMKGYPNSPITGSNEAILNAKNKNIRLFQTKRKASLIPLDNVEGEWTEASPKTVAGFSATAYFFGKKLNDMLDIPIGLINSSWGGANAEAWTDIETLKQFEDIEIPTKIGKAVHHTPLVLYNGMVAPFLGYGIKGAIWYQGEVNRNRPEQYKKLLPAMIKGWRTHWQIGDFPFYMVQIAPYYYGSDYTPLIVEAQVKIMQKVKNTGLATTTDIGNCSDIHPYDKKTVGDRLAYWALAKDYGFDAIAYKAPIYKSMENTEDNKIKITFEKSDRDNGLTNYENRYDIKGFEIAGSDKIFYPAKVKIIGQNELLVWSDKVQNPVAVRYAFGNCDMGTLYNTQGIPVPPFRTDNWSKTRIRNKEKQIK